MEGRLSHKVIVDETIKIINSLNFKPTIRQVFYQLVSRQIINNTKDHYNSMNRMLVTARKRKIIPYSAFVDKTRKIQNYSKVYNTHWRTTLNYIFNLIEGDPLTENYGQDEIIVFHLEKEALAGFFEQVILSNSILVVGKGFSSLSQLYTLDQTLKENPRTCYYYSFSDYDPSGLAIQNSFLDWCMELGILFEGMYRAGLTIEQVKEFKLPINYKKAKDTRAKDWQGGVVELDALDPNYLMNLITEICNSHWNNETKGKRDLINNAKKGIYSKRLRKELRKVGE